MTTTYRTKLFRSVLDCGCSLNLGEFDEEAELDDVRRWAQERGYVLTPRGRGGNGVDSKPSAAPTN